MCQYSPPNVVSVSQLRCLFLAHFKECTSSLPSNKGLPNGNVIPYMAQTDFENHLTASKLRQTFPFT